VTNNYLSQQYCSEDKNFLKVLNSDRTLDEVFTNQLEGYVVILRRGILESEFKCKFETVFCVHLKWISRPLFQLFLKF
jgi:hypothetical protein